MQRECRRRPLSVVASITKDAALIAGILLFIGFHSKAPPTAQTLVTFLAVYISVGFILRAVGAPLLEEQMPRVAGFYMGQKVMSLIGV